MLSFPSKVLLYPQTLLSYEIMDKVLSLISKNLISKLVIIKLSRTLEVMDELYKELSSPWKKMIEFLEVKKELKINWEEVEKEVRAIQEWGLNFRTPENLKYFFQFKNIVEDSLEELIFSFKKEIVKKENYEEKIKIKKALIILNLAENFDFNLLEVKKSLQEIEKKYHQVFEEKIIGEDETFERLENIKELLEISFDTQELPNLNLRIFAWKLLSKYLDWDSVFPLNNILITEKSLLDEWKEKFPFEEKFLEEKIKFYSFKIPIFEILGIPEFSFSKSFSDTGVFFLSL